jgi:NAD-dependent deacetylase sirtuin 4
MYIASLQRLGVAPSLITQNVRAAKPSCWEKLTEYEQVDRLHHKASPFTPEETDRRVLELHGTLHYVHCPLHHHVEPRDRWQERLAELNPRWQQIVEESHGGPLKTNPDGDVRRIPLPSAVNVF